MQQKDEKNEFGVKQNVKKDVRIYGWFKEVNIGDGDILELGLLASPTPLSAGNKMTFRQPKTEEEAVQLGLDPLGPLGPARSARSC